MPDCFADLGVRRVVTAAGHLNRFGGTTVSPRVAAAVTDAASRYVDLRELEAAVVRRVAELTRNEAVAVTCGAAAGVMAAVLACLGEGAAGQPTAGSARVVVHRVHRVPPDRGLELLPVRLVEVGTVFGTDPDEFKAAIAGASAVLHAPGVGPPGAALDLRRVVDLAHHAGVPVIADCAAELPPASNLWRMTRDDGADVAVFSGGKDLGALQASGLVVGRSPIVERCRALGGVAEGPLRALKVGKEQLMAVLAAVEEYVAGDEEERRREAWRVHADWANQWRRVVGVSVWPRGVHGDDPHWLTLAMSGTDSAAQCRRVAAELWDGDPRIAVVVDGRILRLTAFTVDPVDRPLVARRVAQALETVLGWGVP